MTTPDAGSAEIDALLRDLRNPGIDVTESEAALSAYIRDREARAWDEGRQAVYDAENDGWAPLNPECIPRNPYRVNPPGRGSHGDEG